LGLIYVLVYLSEGNLITFIIGDFVADESVGKFVDEEEECIVCFCSFPEDGVAGTVSFLREDWFEFV
jgi:hypothetical protein